MVRFRVQTALNPEPDPLNAFNWFRRVRSEVQRIGWTGPTVRFKVQQKVVLNRTEPDRGNPSTKINCDDFNIPWARWAWPPVLLFATLTRFVPVTPYKFMDMSRHPSSVLASSPTFLRAWTYPLLCHCLLLPWPHGWTTLLLMCSTVCGCTHRWCLQLSICSNAWRPVSLLPRALWVIS